MKKLILLTLLLMTAKAYCQKEFVLIEVFTLNCHSIDDYTSLIPSNNTLVIHWPIKDMESLNRRKRRLESGFDNNNSYMSVEGTTKIDRFDTLEDIQAIVKNYMKEGIDGPINVKYDKGKLIITHSSFHNDIWVIGRLQGQLEPHMAINFQDHSHRIEIPVGTMKEFIVFAQGPTGIYNLVKFDLPKDALK